ncbi:IS3 family transposase [Streptomyces albipurpureus]|uniref:IS3 family transposase n=1 Tax=Streptomyces albipurpureus TaxID=2897419 RepID=A0ABT0ULZ8_9ACTN|nr:IS3 family transposase [Streptomyces sp. CWNU-1]MCM2389647.1 IS3 family transposase [Streptomyces sp. CWNU-1]
MNRCQFVADHQRRFGVKRLCDILGLSRSSFYYWRRTAAARAARQTAEAGIAARTRKVHQDSDGTYGAPRITAELRGEGERINHKRVARIMRTIGVEAVRPRRRHRTTVADQAASKAPDLIGRDFNASEVDTKYVGDITYLPVSGAKPLYLATVIDLASRRLAGWAIPDHMRTGLVTDALKAPELLHPALNHFCPVRELFAAADWAREANPVCAVRLPGFIAPADWTREDAAGVIPDRLPPPCCPPPVRLCATAAITVRPGLCLRPLHPPLRRP